MQKQRSVEEIEKDLIERRARLADLQTKGDAACSQYDLSMGYTAEWYLKSGMIENQIAYLERELQAATPRQQSLF